MQSNPRLDAALAYAARGWHVFPCLPNSKKPRKDSGGLLDATTDAATIEAWWQENPKYNVAIATGPSNLCVIDIDPGGLEGWDDLIRQDPTLQEIENLCPRVDTPRGGFHFYMEGDGPTTASKLANGIDTRGKGGYVLAPPSYVDDGKSKGSYEGEPHVDDLPKVYRPLLDRVAKKEPTQVEPVVPPEQVRWDSPEALTRAEAILKTFVLAGKTAVEGAGGDQTTYEVACAVLELGVTPDTAHKLLADHWNPFCDPPWPHSDLLDKVRNAWKYGQETKGGKAQPPVADQFAHLVPPVEATDDPRGPVPNLDKKYWPVNLKEARKNLKPLEWLVDGVFPKQGIGMLYGAPESYKTFLALDLALSIATGYGPNWWEGQREPGEVIYMIAEGDHAFKGQRTQSWLHKNLVPGLADHIDRVQTIGSVIPFYYTDQWKALAEWLRYYDIAPKLLVIDTYSRAMIGLDEANPGDTAKSTARMEEFAKEFGCFVLAIHHTGKDEARGARGSSALLGNMDAMYEAKRGGTEGSVATQFKVTKLKDGEKPASPFLFRAKQYGDSLAFDRDFEWTHDKDAPAPFEKKDKPPEYVDPIVIARALKDGPLTTEQLGATLSQQFDMSHHSVRTQLQKARKGRLQAYCVDGVWRLPEGFVFSDEQEEF